jgi:phenylacetate-CoA ligase
VASPYPHAYHPTISSEGESFLRELIEHRHAPIFRGETGSRLSASDIEAVRSRSDVILKNIHDGAPNDAQDWLAPFLDRVVTDTPYFRTRYNDRIRPLRIDQFATTSRADLSADIAKFVPDTVVAEELIAYETSGTTGHPLMVPSHPRVAGEYLAYHRLAMARKGLTLTSSGSELCVALLGYQDRCFTYASVMPMQNEAGLVKINLHPNDWRDETDRSKYLESWQPEIVSGDPISFAALLDCNPNLRPKALFSTAMTLVPSLRNRLQQHFNCPVFDFYSMNEAGPIAVYDDLLNGHVVLQPHLHIEILGDAHQSQTNVAVETEIAGEITLTGGFNECLPLVRYRTGDRARLVTVDGERVLLDLVGRAPVRFKRGDGTWVNNVDIHHELSGVGLPQFSLHQYADETFLFSYMGSAALALDATAKLCAYLDVATVASTQLALDGRKLRQYTTDLPDGMVGV